MDETSARILRVDDDARLRELLRDAMETEGFTVYTNEWWHFDFDQWRRYPIQNVTFEQIR